MIHAVRRKNENNERLMRRFKKQVQKFGLIKQVRSQAVHSRSKTKRRIRAEAISREQYREKKRQRILWS